MDPEGRRNGKELRRVEGRKTVIRTYYMRGKKSVFNKIGESSSLKLKQINKQKPTGQYQVVNLLPKCVGTPKCIPVLLFTFSLIFWFLCPLELQLSMMPSEGTAFNFTIPNSCALMHQQARIRYCLSSGLVLRYRSHCITNGRVGGGSS